MKNIRIAIVGVGNCASSLVQGIAHYTQNPSEDGLMHTLIGPYAASNIEVVLAFDVDYRKVGKPLSEAIFAQPNNTTQFCKEIVASEAVLMGRVLDGVAALHANYPEAEAFRLAHEPEPSQDDVVRAMKSRGVSVLLNYLPVGSQQASEFYANCALAAGVAFVNCIPVFIGSNPEWSQRFVDAKIPIIGDDIKAQVGATILHRTICELFNRRGVVVDKTYQLNVGGNTDFLNMLDRSRLASKKESKTAAVASSMLHDMASCNIHVGPSDYVPWLQDNKVCFLRIEGRGFGAIPISLEARLSVEDSPNSAGVVIDAIRCAQLALDRKEGGPLIGPSANFMKHPPQRLSEADAEAALLKFISVS